jgi:alkyl hydroperoxide reductase subunit D
MLDAIKDKLPDWARDARLNLGILESPGELDARAAWGTALAAAATTGSAELLGAIREAAAPHLDDTHVRAALTAASVMAMNNVFYRFRHYVGDAGPYPTLPARMRMQGLANHGVDGRTFELWCLAVSAISGCETCVRNHERSVIEKGGTPQEVHDAVRIASVVRAVAVSLAAAAPAPARTATATAAPAPAA